MNRSFGGTVALALFGAATLLRAAPEAPTFSAVRPARGDVFRYVTLPGKVAAYQQVTLYAKTAGYLKTIKVDKGDAVKAGVVIAEIESPELLPELQRARVEIKRAKAEAVRAEAEVEVAQTTLTRLTRAQQQSPDLVMPQSLDEAKARLATAKASVEVFKAAENAAAANVERLETLLSYTSLRAPFAGMVTARMVDPGAFIPAATSGSPAQSAALLTLMDFSKVRIQVPVPELEAPLVKVGQPMKFTADVLKDRVFTAAVSRHNYALDPGSQTMLVEAEMPNPDLVLRPGMFVTARLGVDIHPNVLTVPSGAVLAEKAGSSVFVVQDGKAKKKAIQLGFNDGAKAEILGGLAGDELVLLPGPQPLADGLAISLKEGK